MAGEPAFLQGRNLRAQGCLKMRFHSAFPTVAAGPVPGCLFSVEGRAFALVLLFLLFPPTAGKDLFSNEQVYIFISPKHSFVDERVVKHLKAIFFDMSFSI